MKLKPGSVFSLIMSSYLAIIVVALAVLATLFSLLFQSFYIKVQQEGFIRQGREVAHLVSTSLEAGSQTYLTSVLDVADRLINGQIWIADKTGLVLASSDNGGNGAGLRLTSEDVRKVLKGKVIARSGRISQFPEPVIFVAVPIEVTRETIGAVLISSPLSGINATVAGVRRLTLAAAAFSILLALFIGFRLSRNLARPLEEMSRIAGDMARGNFRSRTKAGGSNEIIQLGSAFNNLAAELEQTVTSLKVEKNRTESILRSMAEGVVAVDSRMRVMASNPSAQVMLPELPARKTSLKDESMRVSALMSEMHDGLSEALTSGETSVRELALDDGSVILTHFSPIIDDIGITSGAIAVLQDISHRWRLEQMQREFVANVSHELRTPLTSIQGFAEAISDGIVLEASEVRRFASVIVDDVIRLSRLVGDLLDLAKMESGYHRLNLAPISLGAVAERVLGKMHLQAEKAGVRVIYKSLVDNDAVLAEGDRIEQVLYNLVNNAIQHTGKDGTVVVQLCGQDDYIECSVNDNGTGISSDELEHIWKRFRRGEYSRTHTGGGTGLGLAIVKQIVELHGGQVSVESSLGEGSTFSFILPRFPQPLD